MYSTVVDKTSGIKVKSSRASEGLHNSDYMIWNMVLKHASILSTLLYFNTTELFLGEISVLSIFKQFFVLAFIK